MPKVTNEKSVKNNKSKKKANKNKGIDVQGSTKDDKFSFDDEIVIGLKRIDEPVKHNDKTKKHKDKINKKKTVKNELSETGSKKTKNSKNKNTYKDDYDETIISKSKYMSNYDEDDEESSDRYKKTKSKQTNKSKTNKQNKPIKKQATKVLTKKQEISRKKRKRVLKVIKWLTILGIIIGGIIYALLSPIFNIKSITVTGNSKISSEAIVSLSRLNIDQNIFNFRTSNVEEEIKQNPYIDTVAIKRKFPDTVEISVRERTATYMLTYGNAYVYINNQGYILEITSKRGEFPILEGYETPTEQIIEGNRLNIDDLEKLNDVLKIMEAISSGTDGIEEEITTINIEDKTNYILTLDKEKKTIYLGDTTNLSTKVLWINTFIEEEKKNEGIIYLNVNLNTDVPYFREKV